jgi:hypothetical protein
MHSCGEMASESISIYLCIMINSIITTVRIMRDIVGGHCVANLPLTVIGVRYRRLDALPAFDML